jgi:glycine oxidase
MNELSARFAERGANCRYLDAAALEEEEPLLGPKDAGAILLDDEGYVNPRSLHTALRAAFDQLGGHWVCLPALGLASRQGRVGGVETAGGLILGEAVLNTAGAWADRFLLPEEAERLRPRPVRGQIVRLRPSSRRRGIRRVIHMPGTAYMVPHADGTVLVGATAEEVGPFLASTAGGVGEMLAGAREIVPSSTEWRFLRATSGLRPMAADGSLYLEADPGRKGLFHGLGLFRNGILLAPVAASRLARLVLEYLGRKG